MIVTVNLDDEPQAGLSRDQLEDWRQQLKRLAVRFREGLSEC
jgi:hypothetical protein